jgi:hypothetical protein
MSSVDFATWVYEPCFGIFARSVTCYPIKSQPNNPGFLTRGIFDTNEIDVEAANGQIITNARTELDILMPEWNVYPVQGDIFDIPWESDVDGGLFFVSDVYGYGNAGGELTLCLARVEQGRLTGYWVTTSSYSLASPSFATPVLGLANGYVLASPSFATPTLT